MSCGRVLNLHTQIAIEAAKAGKIVFLEKPMALNENELKELVTQGESDTIEFKESLQLKNEIGERVSSFSSSKE